MKLVAAKCPNCGAEIDVDKDSDSTRCDFCGSKIIVEEAIAKYKIEISGKVELDNVPKLENYLKLGEMYYKSKEYQEAYKYYDKAIELDPENWSIILRRGLSKSLSSSYYELDMHVTFNSIKNAYNILKNIDDMTIIDEIINESLEALLILKRYIDDFNDKSSTKRLDIFVRDEDLPKLDYDEVLDIVNKLKDCLDIFEYLYNITNNVENKKKIASIIVNTINDILKQRTYKYSSNQNINYKFLTLKKDFRKNLQEKIIKYSSVINTNDNKARNETNASISLSNLSKDDIKVIIRMIVAVTIVIVMFLGIALGVRNSKFNSNTSFIGYPNFIAPTEEYVIEKLSTVEEITGIEAATKDNDPNHGFSKDDGYTAAVFFECSYVDLSNVSGNTILERGTDGGGCVEVYANVEDAKKRNEYLAKFDKKKTLNSGSHRVIGTVVIRVSSKLEMNLQKEIENKIIDAMKNN